MIVEKLDWLRHAGLQIFSLDIQPDGSRFATAGGDHKVRIWSMAALQNLDDGISQPRLLATLRDHFGSVNCVRWSQGGHLVASGSDDQLVLVHKRHPGSGTTEFGSGEAPDVENWKNILTLRGHTADVVDLGWSPDDSMIASCSLDNTVRIWSPVNGSLISVLQGHQSLVKGVAWDPVGSFLASQSDDKTVMIWHTGKWNAVHKAEGPWEKTVGSTFFRRLAWSPCGHFITTTHGYQEPSHTAPVLERGEWCTSFDFVGHNAPVVAVRYNHSMFRKMPSAETKKLPKGDDSGGGNDSLLLDDNAPYNVIAMGSQDCNITVWTTASPRPVFVGKHFFSQSVVDLSWSTDGYTLLCCSLDGTVATFSFEQKELGLKISKEEMEDFKKTRYGDVQVRRLMLVESPAQLQLEAAAAKQLTISAVAEVQPPVREKSLEVLPPNSTSDRRQQTEYRGPDGRRRIIPKPLGQDYKENEAPDGLKSSVNESFGSPAGSKNVLLSASRQEGTGRIIMDAGVPPVKQSNGHEIQRVVPQSGIPDYAPMQTDADVPKVPSGITTQAKLLVQPPTSHGGVLSIEVQPSYETPVCLEARLVEMPHKVGFVGEGHAGDSVMETDIVCSQGGKVLWWDRLRRKATILTGNSNMWVVACEDNSVQVYTAAGRRALPPIILSSSAAFMDCDKEWKLLLLTCCGALQIWDLRSCVSILRESVSAILSSTPKPPFQDGDVRVISARISEAGAPLIVLENQHIFLFHMDLKCWVQVADSFPSSRFCKFSPMLTTIMSKGDPSPKRVGALGSDGTFNLSRAGLLGRDNGSFTRGQLEFEMAVAVALQSADEYRRCLLAYARCLARDADTSRLRELCEELLGPPDELDGVNDSSPKRGWDPVILGLKKRELLKHDVLPAMASNRSIQRLLAEFVDLLVEVESRTKPVNPESA
ncbi:unnamed protein product [Calypogeia fissa]